MIRIPNWQILTITSGASMIILAILWLKRDKRKQSGKKQSKNSGTAEISNHEQKFNVSNYALPELPKSNWIRVGTVKELFFYPLKSGRGRKLNHCEFSAFGISVPFKGHITMRDRMFLVYNEETGKFQTGRQYPSLILVSINSINETSVKLEAVGMPSLVFKVPANCETNLSVTKCTMWFGEKVECIDCGVEPAKWISRFLTGIDSGLRLGYTSALQHRDLGKSPWKKYMDVYKSMRNEDTGIFSDLASYMIMTTGSLEDLNKHIETPVSALQFRPNILISGPEAFSEDNWDWIKIGENAVIRNFKSCSRCKMICVNPETAIPNGDEPLTTLKKYRKVSDEKERNVEGDSPKIGIYCGLYVGGEVKAGDEVYVCLLENTV